VHVTEHACFFLAGLLAWTQIVDPARRKRLGPSGRAIFAFAMLVVSSLIAETLIATGPVYAWSAHLRQRPPGWTAGQDQSHAAVIMMAEQIATLGIAIIFLGRAYLERVAADLPSHGV